MYSDSLKKYLSEKTYTILQREADIRTLQDVLDCGAEKIKLIDGIGKKRFNEIADIAVNVGNENPANWIWKQEDNYKKDKKGADSVGKKSKKTVQRMAVYRIVDTERLNIVFVGYTKDLTKNTLKTKLDVLKREAEQRGKSLDGRYILDCIYIGNKKNLIPEREKFFRAYKPEYGAEIQVSADVLELTEEDNARWKPFISDRHDGVTANRNILNHLDRAGRLEEIKKSSEWSLVEIYISRETERALRSLVEEIAASTIESSVAKAPDFYSGFEETLKSVRQQFVQLVNEKYAGTYNPVLIYADKQEQAEDTEETAESATEADNTQTETSVEAAEKTAETAEESPDTLFEPDSEETTEIAEKTDEKSEKKACPEETENHSEQESPPDEYIRSKLLMEEFNAVRFQQR